MLETADRILARAAELLDPACLPISPGPATRTIERLRAKLLDFVNMTIKAGDQARRRVLAEESVPNAEKLFSVFEPQTQLIKRGKVPQPVEFGHRVLVIEDGAGFVCQYAILPHGAEDSEVVVEQMRQVQGRLGGRIRSASFDRGFHSPANQRGLAELVSQPCLATKGHVQAERQERAATVAFGVRGGVIRGWSRRSALCSRATAWSGAGTGASGATAATWGWGCWAGIFTCWASC